MVQVENGIRFYAGISRQAHQLKSSFGMFGMDTTILDLLERKVNASESIEQIKALEN